MSDDNRFCPHCEVSIDLHPEQGPDEMTVWDCDIAKGKADMVERFGFAIVMVPR